MRRTLYFGVVLTPVVLSEMNPLLPGYEEWWRTGPGAAAGEEMEERAVSGKMPQTAAAALHPDEHFS